MKERNADLDMICRTCEHAELLVDSDVVLCDKKGIVSAGGHCRKFIYDALKREPPKKVKIEEHEYIDIDA